MSPLHAAAEGHALSAELEWAHTSLDDVLALVRSRLTRGQQSWASLAIWTRRQPATEEVQLVSGMGLTLERLEQDAAYRSFWQELGSLIQPDGHLMLLGLGDAASLEAVEEVPEERHRLFERLAKVTRRQLVLQARPAKALVLNRSVPTHVQRRPTALLLRVPAREALDTADGPPT